MKEIIRTWNWDVRSVIHLNTVESSLYLQHALKFHYKAINTHEIRKTWGGTFGGHPC